MRCGVAKTCVVQCSRVVGYFNCVKDTLFIRTSNNQRLRNAGSNDRRSKRFCSNAVLCVSFTLQMVKTRVIRLRVFDGSNAHDQIARFYTFHSFLVEVQTKAGVLTIYPNHAGQNLVHKHKTEKLTWWEKNPLQSQHPDQLNRLKRVEKLHCLKTQPMFSETSQTEWREPVDFPTGISGFSMEMRNNKLEIRIGGSSCRPQQNVKSKIKQSYKRK